MALIIEMKSSWLFNAISINVIRNECGVACFPFATLKTVFFTNWYTYEVFKGFLSDFVALLRTGLKIYAQDIVLTTHFFSVPTTASAEQKESHMPSSTTLYETSDFAAIRQGKHFIIEFKESHQVLSTSDINGGQTSSLKYLVNFQSVEGNAHNNRFDEILSLSD